MTQGRECILKKDSKKFVKNTTKILEENKKILPI